jgi:hypothetical protein
MQPRHDNNPQRYDGEATRPLPKALAEGLAPETRHALMHGMRRCILRAFDEVPIVQTTRDLMPTFPGVTLQTITYHVLVLEEFGSVTVSHIEQGRGSFSRSFVSNVANNPEVVAALQATERLDDVL